MRLKIIIPNSSNDFLLSQKESRTAMLSPDFTGEVICLQEGPVSLESACDEALVAGPLLREVRIAEAEGYDAICIDCAADPIPRAIRELIRIPVISAGEAAITVALVLGDRFSVITVLDSTRRIIEGNIRKYSLTGRCASVRAVGIPVLALDDLDRATDAILKEAGSAVEKDGADVIVLGCTGMSSSMNRLRASLDVPVVDPAEAGIRVAESLARMRVSHSRKCYPATPSKEIKGAYLSSLGII